MKNYLLAASIIILSASVTDAQSKAVDPDAKLDFKFSREKTDPVKNNGMTNLQINTDGNVSCETNLDFTFDDCPNDTARECAAIQGKLHCSYKPRRGNSITLDKAFTWDITENDPQSIVQLNPYNIGGCSRKGDPHHLKGCLIAALKTPLQFNVTASKGVFTYNGSINGCSGCKVE